MITQLEYIIALLVISFLLYTRPNVLVKFSKTIIGRIILIAVMIMATLRSTIHGILIALVIIIFAEHIYEGFTDDTTSNNLVKINVSNFVTWDEANKLASDNGGRLPTKDEFKSAMINVGNIDMWMPATNNDDTNYWVHVGTGGWSLYSTQPGVVPFPPAWGLTNTPANYRPGPSSPSTINYIYIVKTVSSSTDEDSLKIQCPDGYEGPNDEGNCTAGFEDYDIGVDYPGNDLRTESSVNSPEECQQMCQKDSSCKYFTYSTDESTHWKKKCWLKTAKNKQSPPSGLDLISGPKYSKHNCDESCAKDNCSKAGGYWIPLDYSSHPYTCKMTFPEPTCEDVESTVFVPPSKPAPAPAPPPTPLDNYTKVPNKDIGGFLSHFPGETPEQLATKCDADKNCVAFNSGGWTKWMTGPQATSTLDLYVKKDAPSDLPQYKVISNTDSPGAIGVGIPGKSAVELSKLCNNTPGCKGFNHNPVYAGGWLKNIVSPTHPYQGLNLYVKQ